MSKAKKLIFISGTPISNIVGNKLNVKYYEKNGIEIEYWNLTPLYYSEKALSAYFGGHKEYRFQFPREKLFSNKNEVNTELQKLTSDIIVSHIDFNQQDDYWIRRLFKLYEVKYFVGPRRTSVPLKKSLYLSKVEIVYKLISAVWNRSKISFYKRKLHSYLYQFTNYYQKPIFVVSSGIFGNDEWLNISQSKRVVSVPSKDLAWQTLPRLVNDDYCIYVDDGVVYSPDQNMMTGIKSTSTNLTEYSKNICKSMDLIEQTTGCRVVISASGKYHYSDTTIFGNREIVYSKNNQLIQHAKLVLGHSSSGLWQVIPSMKPVLLLWDSSFIKAKNNAVSLTGAFLGVLPIMSNKLTALDITNIFDIDKKYYQLLIDNYFCEDGVQGTAEELIMKNFT